jgi:4-amino-4-deoxy-L-arabinose transferase-like glycosyltransferase
VRFFSPVIGAIISVLILRFFARELNARAGFFLVLIATATPLASVGAVLMTIDPLSVLFWTAAMLAGWRAIQPQSKTSDWAWVGLWMGLGFLSKYTELFQWLCWAVLFVLWPPARKQLKRPGPYLALVINAVCSIPVLVWNAQHQWITVEHLKQNAGMDTAWHPTLRFTAEFLGSELGLMNPVFFIAMIWAAVALWRRGRNNPYLIYFFSMGAPLFLAYFLHSFRSRVLPNWIAPAVIPLFCMMVVYWDARLRLGVRGVQGWLKTGVILGAILVILGHDTNIVKRVTGYRKTSDRLLCAAQT